MKCAIKWNKSLNIPRVTLAYHSVIIVCLRRELGAGQREGGGGQKGEMAADIRAVSIGGGQNHAVHVLVLLVVPVAPRQLDAVLGVLLQNRGIDVVVCRKANAKQDERVITNKRIYLNMLRAYK
jgi:hypothetical protein